MDFSNSFLSFFQENDFFRNYFEFPENTPTDLQLNEEKNKFIIQFYFSFHLYSDKDRDYFLKILENNNILLQIQILKFFNKKNIIFRDIFSKISVERKIGLLEFIVEKNGEKIRNSEK